eukprot:scaffold1.g5322.t1
MAAPQVALPPSYAALKLQLEKKATFEAACAMAIDLLHAQPAHAAEPDLHALLRRVRTLLRSRYSSPAFWSKGRQLFRAAQQLAGSGPLAAELAAMVAECEGVLGDDASTSDSAHQEQQQLAAARQPQGGGIPYLFEGQMAANEPAPRPQSDLETMLAAVAAQVQQREGGSGGGGSEHPAMQLTPELVEQLEQELDAIAVQIMEESGQEVPRPAPPASKAVVRSLPQETLSAARLAELGGAEGVRCPVCMEEYAKGDEVIVLPCKHTFHPPCLAPWLENNNSCPTCRHELPTDDAQYERRKEREAAEAEERRGASNATSGAEFLYL